MCITTRSAELTKTKILTFLKDDGSVYLSYTNKAKNISADGRNCMVLPIPGKVLKFYDTTTYAGFLDLIANETLVSESLNYGVYSRGLSKGFTLGVDSFSLGMYDIFVCDNVQTLTQVTTIQPELYTFFEQHYPDFSFVCCYFDSDKSMGQQPIAFDYKPLNDTMLFFPTMDAHTGGAPKDIAVRLDHELITKLEAQCWGKIQFTSDEVNIPDFLEQVYGTYKLSGSIGNGDVYLDLSKQSLSSPNLTRSFEVKI